MLRITEAELARDVHAALAKVQHGAGVVIEQHSQPIAVIKPSQPSGRLPSEILAELRKHGSPIVVDEDFARDVQAGIDMHREPWNPPSWD